MAAAPWQPPRLETDRLLLRPLTLADADTLFAPGAIAALVAPLADRRVGAVAGNAKVGNRINMITRWQALEYIVAQNLERRALPAAVR